jgi:hypothetical protein
MIGVIGPTLSAPSNASGYCPDGLNQGSGALIPEQSQWLSDGFGQAGSGGELHN